MLIAVLIDEDGNVLSAHGPFPSSVALRVWADRELIQSINKSDKIEWHRYEEVKLVGVTEDKG
jgi:hypothetical protein